VDRKHRPDSTPDTIKEVLTELRKKTEGDAVPTEDLQVLEYGVHGQNGFGVSLGKVPYRFHTCSHIFEELFNT
jgi:hypothetical protein